MVLPGVDMRTAGDVGAETGNSQVGGGPRGHDRLVLGLGKGWGEESY